jgi:hypothetical protein
MAIVKVTNSKASISKAISYVTKEEKTEEKLVSGINCTPESAIDEMKATKEQFRKTEGRQYAHYIQSFSPDEKITHDQAHKIALELSEKQFKGYEVLVVTHKDKSHIHSHIVVNSVSYEDGRKLHSSKKDLAEVKDKSNEICEREGLTRTEPNKTTLTSFDNKKYKALEKGMEGEYKSYMLDLWKHVNSFMKKAKNKEQFIESMKEKGYGVSWSDTRKNITFTTPEGKKVRNSNLAKTFKNDKFTKEGLLNEFRRNGEEVRREGDKSRKQDNTTEFKPSTRSVEQDIKQANEPIRSGAYEGGEYGTQKTTSDFYNKLREIRSIGDEYSPDARREARERAEQMERERIKSEQNKLAERERVTEQQPSVKRQPTRDFDLER